MDLLDVLIILFLLVALVRGNEVGFVRQASSTIGFFVGLLSGAWLQSKLINTMHTPASKAILSLAVVLLCIIIFMIIFEIAGAVAKHRLKDIRIANGLDRVLGSLVAGVTLLLAVWMCAAIFRGGLSEGWQRQIAGSRIVTGLNSSLPSAPNVIARLGHLIDPNTFPQVFTGLEPRIQSDAPLPDLGTLTPAVEKTRASVIKVEGEGCGGIVEGSGFVARSGMVVTNAHVVAGVAKPYIIDQTGQHRATVVMFDPRLDIAVLRATQLAAPLPLGAKTVPASTDGAVVGYPGGGGFDAKPAVVTASFIADGKDIYNQQKTERHVYSLKADVRGGNSGGPLIATDGTVIGVIFARSTAYDKVGYALTMEQVIGALNQAQGRTAATSTGTCTE